MVSPAARLVGQGVWAALTGGWYHDPEQGAFTNSCHLYLWLFLLTLPMALHLVRARPGRGGAWPGLGGHDTRDRGGQPPTPAQRQRQQGGERKGEYTDLLGMGWGGVGVKI